MGTAITATKMTLAGCKQGATAAAPRLWNTLAAAKVQEQEPLKCSMATSSQFQPKSPSTLPRLFASSVISRAAEFRNKVAVCDADGGNYLYEDIFRRSVDLAHGIREIVGSSSLRRRQKSAASPPRVGFLCPGGSSYVIAQWACWMSGSTAVPLDPQQTETNLIYCIGDADCDVVIADRSYVDKVNDICKRSQKKLICLDNTWTANPKKEFDTSLPLPSIPGELNKTDDAMILFSGKRKGNPQRLSLTHSQLNAQAEIVSNSWDLNDKCSVLHCVPLDSPYGAITSLLAPLSIGGKVVMLKKFDTVKVWSCLLGINVNNSLPLPKVNLYPGVPVHYQSLLDRYYEFFADRKSKDYVRQMCKKRLRGTVSSLAPLSDRIRRDWAAATGLSIADCYTTGEAGTVLSEELDEKATADDDLKHRGMKIMDRVQTRIVRYDDKSGAFKILDHNAHGAAAGTLVIRSPGMSLTGQKSKLIKGGWLDLGIAAKVSNGRITVTAD